MSENSTTHRIVSLQVNNFKNLKAVSITPEGNVVTLSGENGAGKSAILDAIQEALAGKGSATARPIREGADNAETVIDLGHGLVAKRRYTPGGSTLRIETADGKQSSPQTILDSLTTNLAFDPLAFTRLEPKKQREALMRLLGLDFSELDKAIKKTYDDRTLTNRELDSLTAHINALPHLTATGSTAEVLARGEMSASEILLKLEALNSHNRVGEGLESKRAQCYNAKISARTRLSEAENELARLKEEVEKRRLEVAGRDAEFDAVEKAKAAFVPAEVAPLRTALANVEKLNAEFRTEKLRAELLDARKAKQDMVNSQTKYLAQCEQAKQNAIRNAKLPLPGLEFDDAGLLMNGRPLTEESTGNRIRASVAIGMAMNPKLRVIFIRDGSLLDKAGLAIVAEMAAANDFQVWIEDARSDNPAALVISDGSIK